MQLHRSRPRRRGRIEIIPMIDVMFFLLASFMLASLSMQALNSLPVNLPRGEAAAMDRKDSVTLTVTKDSQIFLDKTPATLATIPTLLRTMLRGPDSSVVVAADSAAPEGLVVEALLEARRAGVAHFLLAVQHD
jgi:biopolymer transport protein ExbD